MLKRFHAPLLALVALFCAPAVVRAQDVPASPRAVRISGGVMAAQIVAKVDPVYPPEARAQGIGGAVVLHAVIGTDGSVKQLRWSQGRKRCRPPPSMRCGSGPTSPICSTASR